MKLHGSRAVYKMDDFAKTPPAFGYSKKLNKIIFKNHEAFWMCCSAAEKQGMMSDVPFEYDDNFLKQAIKELEIDGKPTQKQIQKFLQNKLIEALHIRDEVGDDHFKMFKVDGTDPDNAKYWQPLASKSLKGKSWSESKQVDVSS